MTVREIIRMESGNQNTIILLREGIFWRAYEKSAYAFSFQIHPYKPTRKWVVAVKQDVVSLGFPVSATEGVLKDCKILLQQEDRLVLAASTVGAEDFEHWKQSVPMALADGGRTPKANFLPVSEKEDVPSPASPSGETKYEEIAETIRRFNIESKTPVECMLFLMKLKRMLAE